MKTDPCVCLMLTSSLMDGWTRSLSSRRLFRHVHQSREREGEKFTTN